MRGDETKLYKISEASEILGIGPAILRRWDANGEIKTVRTPGGIRLFDISSIQIHNSNKQAKQAIVLYSRVSSAKQKQDLNRQKDYVRAGISAVEQAGFDILEISDVGSGINFKRPGLLRILGLVKEGKVSKIVVASKDRLARFGFELIQWLCTEFKTQIVVLDTEDTTPESELGNDLMAIVQVYCCRWNGRRRYKTCNKNQSDEIEITANTGTKEDDEPVGGLCSLPLQQDDSDFDEQEDSKSSEEEIQSPRQISNSNRKQKEKNKKQLLQQQTVATTMP